MPGHTDSHGRGVGGQSPGPRGQRGRTGGGGGGGGSNRQPGLAGSASAKQQKKDAEREARRRADERAATRREAARIATEEENKRVAEIRKRQADEAAATRREAARIATEEENKRVAEIRKRQAEEAAAAERAAAQIAANEAIKEEEARVANLLGNVNMGATKGNLSSSLVDKLSPGTLEQLLAGGHGIDGSTFEGLGDDTKTKVVGVLDQLETDKAAAVEKVRRDLFDYTSGLELPVTTFDQAQQVSMAQLTDRQRQELLDRGFDLSNLAFTPGEGLFGLKQQPLIRDINTGEVVARPSQGLTGPIGAGLAALGVDTSSVNFGVDRTQDRGGRQDERLAGIPTIAQTATQRQDAEDAEEEVLTGFTRDQRGTGTGFTPSMGGTGIASTPAAGNYMDYINYAFRPVNLATPFAGQPTQQITGFNPLFGDNPVYRAHGGFIGFMDEPLNIMYPSNGNMVVHDGISGILKKYKEIRSEL